MPSDRGELVELGGVGLCIGFPVLPPAVKQEDEEGNDDDNRTCPASKGRPVELQKRVGIAALVDDSVVVGLPLMGRLFCRGLRASATHGKADGSRRPELGEPGVRTEVGEADARAEGEVGEEEAWPERDDGGRIDERRRGHSRSTDTGEAGGTGRRSLP